MLGLAFLPFLLNPAKRYITNNRIVNNGKKPGEGFLTSNWKRAGEDIVKDSVNVYYRGKRVKGIDAPSFHEIERPVYADKNRLYFTNSNVLYGKHKLAPLKGNYDLNSFESLDYYSTAYKDKNGIYVKRNRFQILPTKKPLKKVNIPELDLASFKSLKTPNWHADTNHVYFARYGKIKLCKNIDHSSFKILSHIVSKDKNHVYYLTHFAQTKDKKITSNANYRILNGADAATFVKCKNSHIIKKELMVYKDKYGSWVNELRTVRAGKRAKKIVNYLARSEIKCE